MLDVKQVVNQVVNQNFQNYFVLNWNHPSLFQNLGWGFDQHLMVLSYFVWNLIPHLILSHQRSQLQQLHSVTVSDSDKRADQSQRQSREYRLEKEQMGSGLAEKLTEIIIPRV